MVQPLSFFRRHPKTAPLLVYFLSLCYLVFLVSSTQPGIFFSGDGGLKFMVVKQLQTGHGFKYLYLPQPDWVHKIWQSGYFPFGSPFVYPSPNSTATGWKGIEADADKRRSLQRCASVSNC